MTILKDLNLIKHTSGECFKYIVKEDFRLACYILKLHIDNLYKKELIFKNVYKNIYVRLTKKTKDVYIGCNSYRMKL